MFLMTVEGENDDISGMVKLRLFALLCVNLSPNRRRDHVQKGVGHYGVFSGALALRDCPSDQGIHFLVNS